MASDDVQEFTLDGDGDPSDAGAGAPADHGGATAPPARPATHAWRGPVPWAVCAVVLILAGVFIVPSQQNQVTPWGGVDNITTPPIQAWEREGDWLVRSALMTEEALVIVRPGDVVGVEMATGDRMWSHPLDRGTCTTDGHSVVCADGDSQIVELAGDTGATLGTIEVDGALAATRSAGDWFVLIGEQGGNEDEIARFSGGEKVWSTPVLAEEMRTPRGNTMAVIAGRLLVTTATPAGSGMAVGGVFDAATGEPLKPEADTGGSTRESFFALFNNARGIWSAVTSGGGTLYIRGQDEPQETSAVGARMGYDGGWRGQLLPRRPSLGGGVGMFDAASGQWLWQEGEGSGRAMARLDETLISLAFAENAPPTMTARDTSSGEMLWSKQGTWVQCPCLADEHTLAVARSQLRTEPSGAMTVKSRQLIGLEARTGEVLWQLDSPQGMFSLLTDGDYMVAVASSEIRAWELG